MAAAMPSAEEPYDRAAEINEFEATKLGVKGLVDSGVSTIPRFFVHSPDTLTGLSKEALQPRTKSVPTIDLTGVDLPIERAGIVREVSHACREWGFFQIINHGVPTEVLDRVVAAVKGFHELPDEEKATVYRREKDTGVAFYSNFDLFHSKAASWRDTLHISLAPKFADIDEVPEVCRAVVVDWDLHVQRVGAILMELMCEGMGLSACRLHELTCLGTRVMVAHYYPQCRQPHLTVGIAGHTDPGVVTMLLQDQVGGLQVKHGEDWVDIKPVPGALVINVGDFLQIMSNDEYKSVEHRVLANPLLEPRVSVAVFCNPSSGEREFKPFLELLSPEKPPLFRQFTYGEYMRRFFTKELDGKSLLNYYRS